MHIACIFTANRKLEKAKNIHIKKYMNIYIIDKYNFYFCNQSQ